MYLDYLMKASNVCKEYKQGSGTLKVLKHLNLELKKGDALCIVGPSGAGKSTFLHILGTLDQPTSGHIFYKKQDLSLASEKERAQFRRECLGFVFQFHYLLHEFNALENVMIAGHIGEQGSRQSQKRAMELLDMMNLTSRWKHFPNELSGGEQQRVSIARALMNSPEILLVDEPTGNLDTQNSDKLLHILLDLRERLGLTLIAVSHDSKFSSSFPKILKMEDGKWANVLFKRDGK